MFVDSPARRAEKRAVVALPNAGQRTVNLAGEVECSECGGQETVRLEGQE